MRIVWSDEPWPAELRGGVFAIGNFDGLHRGHQALFDAAKRRARAERTCAGVLTFEPHPAKVLSPAFAPPLLLRFDEKMAGLGAAGIDVVAVRRFDLALARMSAEAFVEEVIVERLGASAVVVGEGFRFGSHARGTVDDLRRVVAVDVVEPVREGDLVCSSTKIRELVLAGRVDAAARLLGSPYFLEGEVVGGDRRGHTIGIPTANLDTQRELLPKVGVYATRARLVDGRVFDSVTNIGLRPTFQGQGVRIEAHLLGFPPPSASGVPPSPRDADLYGQRLRLDLIGRVRDEQRFANIDELKAQIAGDIDAARAILGAPA